MEEPSPKYIHPCVDVMSICTCVIEILLVHVPKTWALGILLLLTVMMFLGSISLLSTMTRIRIYIALVDD